jgi:hypothetical protein
MAEFSKRDWGHYAVFRSLFQCVDVVLVADMFVLYPVDKINLCFPAVKLARVTCLMLPWCGLLNHGFEVKPHPVVSLVVYL